LAKPQATSGAKRETDLKTAGMSVLIS